MKLHKRPWYNDPRSRTFSHHALFGSVAPAALPQTLGRARGPILNQGDTTRCTGYGSAANGWCIHGAKMAPDWAAYKIGKKQGHSVDAGGGDPNTTMKHMRDDGFLRAEEAPFSLEKDGVDGSGFSAPWPAALDTDAAKNDTCEGFVKVDGPYDTFGNICNALLLAYDPKTGRGAAVDAFSGWYAEWNEASHRDAKGIMPQGETLEGFHRFIFVDFTMIDGIPYLIAQQSCGEEVGDNGILYFPREVVNREFTQRGRSLKILKTLTPEQLALAKQETVAGLIQRIIGDVWYALSEMIARRL